VSSATPLLPPDDDLPPRRRPGDGWLIAIAVAAILLALAGIIIWLVTRDEGNGPKRPTRGAEASPIVVYHGQWQCTSPQDGTIVIVQDPINVKKDPPEPYSAAVNITEGCTGTIGSIVVVGNQRDGIKVGKTAHDVEILSGWVYCGPRAGDVHQDGIQAGGGQHVHFHNMHIDCPESNNAAMFINQTNGGSGVRPTDITCTNCDLLSNNNALNVGADSTDSGARFSILRKGKGNSAPANCKRVNGTGAVDEGNECVEPNATIDTGQPAPAE
jgi:hypothetical protein